MGNYAEIANSCDRIENVLRRLIDNARKCNRFERITIVTPSNQSSFYLRRSLAKEGLFNVDFKRLEDIAERLTASVLDVPLLHDLQASEFVFEAAREEQRGSWLGGSNVSPQLQTALHSTFRNLELLGEEQITQLAARSEPYPELIARFTRYLGLAEGYRRNVLMAEKAAEIIRGEETSCSKELTSMGKIVLVEGTIVAPVQRPLFDALAARADTINISTVSTPADFENTPSKISSDLDQPYINPVSVPDVAEEVRGVARRIVGLARSGKRFAQIAVLFEDDSYANRIGEALELANVPVSGPDRTALKDTPEGRFIIGVLDIFENGFTRSDVSAWLSTAPIKDPGSIMTLPGARWDAISRNAGVTLSVEDSWIPRLDRYANNIVSRAKRSERLEEGPVNQAEAAETDAKLASQLRDFVSNLQKLQPSAEQDTWTGFVRWIRRLMDQYLLVGDSEIAQSGLTRLLNLVERLETLEIQGSAPGFEHCAGVVREQLGRRSAGLRSLGAGVYVGPLWTAVGCPFETVFILGMSEGSYPSSGFTDPLLPDPIKREIDPEGRNLKTREKSIEENHRTYLSVIISARQVFMYWPRGIPGEPREFGPSRWFLDAVRKVSGETFLQAGKIVSQPVTGLTVQKRTDLEVVSPNEASDLHDYDVIASRNWSAGGHSASEFPLVAGVPTIARSMRFISGQSSEAWTEFDGNIEQVDSDDRFKDTVGSATAFETYASCPYRYFLSRRLHVEPTESPEAGQTIDSLTFGTLIHDVLEQFAVWRMGWTGQTPLLNDQEDWLRAETASHIAKLRDETPSRSEGAWKIEQSRAWLILRQWLRREGDTAQQPRMRQVETEYSFGRTGAAPAVEVRTSTGKSVKFRGQVDRVDISDDGSQVIVYDYKSGGTSAYSKLDSDPVKKGTKLQLPLYSKAVAQKYPESDVRASYWFVREVGSSELTPQPEKYNQKIAESAFAAAVETIVEGIDQGNYPARPGDPVTYGEGGPTFENCLYCEYVRVCPKSKAHLWDLKKSSDPTLQGYVDLSEVDA